MQEIFAKWDVETWLPGNWENKRSYLIPALKFCCCCLVNKLYPTLQPHGLESTKLLCPWDFPGKNTGVGCHFLLQGLFLTQGSNPRLLQMSSVPLSHQGSVNGSLPCYWTGQDWCGFQCPQAFAVESGFWHLFPSPTTWEGLWVFSQFLRSRLGVRWRRKIKRRVPLNTGVKQNCRKAKLRE